MVTIGYRNENACWIGNETALLIVFAAPIGSVLVYNVLAFTQTIYAINRYEHECLSFAIEHCFYFAVGAVFAAVVAFTVVVVVVASAPVAAANAVVVVAVIVVVAVNGAFSMLLMLLSLLL